MYVYRYYESFDIVTDVPSGSTDIIVAGDVSTKPELQPDRRIFLMSQNDESVWEGNIVSSISYDSVSDQTTIVCTNAFVNSFTAGDAKLYSSRVVNTEVGSMVGDGLTTSFAVSDEPTEVRLYTSGAPWGIKLENANPPGDNQWYYDSENGQVVLGFTPSTGDVVVAFRGETYLLDGKYLADDVAESVEEYIFLEPAEAHDCLYVGFDQYIAADVTQDWMLLGREISPGTWDWYAHHIVCSISAGSFYRFKLKAILSNAADVHNYYNVSLRCGYLDEPAG